MGLVETTTRQPNRLIMTLWGSHVRHPRLHRSFNHGQPPCHARSRRRFSSAFRCSWAVAGSSGQSAATHPGRRRIGWGPVGLHASAASWCCAAPPTHCVWRSGSRIRAISRQLSTHHSAADGDVCPDSAQHPGDAKWCGACRFEAGGVTDHVANPRRGFGCAERKHCRILRPYERRWSAAGDGCAAGPADVAPVSVAAS